MLVGAYDPAILTLMKKEITGLALAGIAIAGIAQTAHSETAPLSLPASVSESENICGTESKVEQANDRTFFVSCGGFF